MNQYAIPRADHETASPAEQIGALRAILQLVRSLAGEETVSDGIALRDADTLYADAPTLIRRRFDALAGETAAIAATGLSALIAGRQKGNVHSAAAFLAQSMDRAIRRMEQILG